MAPAAVRPLFRLALLSILMLPLTGPAGAQTRPAPAAPAASLIDLNSASRDTLMELEGIGEVRADAIIRSRPFKTKADLVERWIVPEELYEKIAGKVTVRPIATPAAPTRPTTPPKR
ncbi:MAG: helix-hairpin-helix domain-containing protein [Proteobacteria bacterium]|nr:helix-hairpin-helix domain-containing protein [Pseudomonadota bacterium]